MPFINILFIVYALDNFIPISFGFEIWFIAIFLYYLSWRLLIGFWPLKNTKKDEK